MTHKFASMPQRMPASAAALAPDRLHPPEAFGAPQNHAGCQGRLNSLSWQSCRLQGSPDRGPHSDSLCWPSNTTQGVKPQMLPATHRHGCRCPHAGAAWPAGPANCQGRMTCGPPHACPVHRAPQSRLGPGSSAPACPSPHLAKSCLHSVPSLVHYHLRGGHWHCPLFSPPSSAVTLC